MTGLRKRTAAICSGPGMMRWHTLRPGSRRQRALRPGMNQRHAQGQGSRTVGSGDIMVSREIEEREHLAVSKNCYVW
jgi:hypothetical protein